MARKSPKPGVVEAARKVAAPFWQRVGAAGLDRFFLERLLRGLLRRWREDRFARVKQGGLHGDSRADLARVFIDLDASPGPGSTPGAPTREAERIVASWMRTGRRESGKPNRRRPFQLVDAPPELRSGLSVPVEVVLGGPGQGKSTVGRFLVLIHASILLLTSPIEGIAPAADLAHMEALLAGLAAEDIGLPETLRLPIWVELRELADALLNDPESQSEPLAALLGWVATNDLREPSDAPGLETALESLPWVLVLDGLDEVPPQRGRALVRGCVESVRRRFAGAEGWVIATSRPQSYEREVFGEGLFERTLLPLVKERAEVYAARFAECLHGEEEGQRAHLLKGMRKALSNPATAALMTNPLLVTIMAAIVLHHGEPSDRRWTLFEEYYTTLYQRETERGTYASATLRQHAPLITAIHMHVGMSLQVRSEEAEGVSALMPEQELRAIIREHLIADFSEDEAARLTEEILRAAEQRLVLLVQSQRGMYGFDLRSFQELMAGWQIVSLQEAQASALLRRVAPLTAWRNVVLFAMGHQYAENLPLAWERSVGLCAALDLAEEGGSRLALPGARLALAVLADAPYGKATRPRQELISRALELLRLPPDPIHRELAARVWGMDPERLLAECDRALEDPARREAAWIVVMDLPDDDRVTVLMKAHWPANVDGQRAIIDRYYNALLSSFHGEFDGSARVSRRVANDLSLARPDELWLLLQDAALAVIPREGGDFVAASLSLLDGECHFSWSCGGVTSGKQKTARRIQGSPRTGPWAVVHAASSFTLQPTAATLANALDELADGWADRTQWIWDRRVAWPLLACMMAASSSGELRAIADRLRRGELGESHRWLEIEAKLGGEGWEVGVDDLRAFATSPDPLRFVLVQGRIPPFDSTRDSPIRAWGEGAIQRHHLRQIDEVGCAAGDPWVRRMVAQLFFELVETFPTPAEPASEEAWPSVDDVIRLLHTAETPVVLETMAALCHPLGPREVTAILANTMTPIVVASYRSTPKPATSLVQILEEALLSSPGSPRLQQALLKVLDFEASHGRAPVVNIHAAGDSADARLLRLLSGHAALEDLQALGRLLSVTGMSVSFALLDAHESSRPFVLPLIEALLALPETSTRLRSEAVDFLAERIASGTVGLASPDQWTAAGLPAPPPMTHHTERPELPGAHIASVEINNLRAFPQRFEVSAPVPAGPGQWMVFLGENATGKTTLLRAVAMALASPSDAAAVPSNVEGPLRRDASRDGFVLVRTRDGRDLTTTITGPGADERIVVTPEDALRPWVVGYGCRRGSAIGGTDMDNAFVPFRDLDNLFDRERGVIRASGWLKELQRLARNNGKRSRDIYEAARKALCGALLGAESIVVENDVSVVFEGNRRVPLALLSDGYLTTAGWIVDLMARWLKRNEGRKTVDDTFCAAMEGVVLLDEIDLHLHPRWQERVIEDVRSLFPRMTFIATTHHPLTLRGARKGEVFVLGDHDGSGAISALQRDIPPGTRVDELLTGEWFNRPSAIVDEETRRMLDEHQRLILAGAKAGTPERKALETKLRERLGRFADTSLERLAATIVAQHLDASLPEPSAQQRERVRQEVLKILQRRDKKRG